MNLTVGNTWFLQFKNLQNVKREETDVRKQFPPNTPYFQNFHHSLLTQVKKEIVLNTI